MPAVPACHALAAVTVHAAARREVVELLRKLALTSILALISPGSAGQGTPRAAAAFDAPSCCWHTDAAHAFRVLLRAVVVGLILAFVMLLANISLKPFAEKPMNIVRRARVHRCFDAPRCARCGVDQHACAQVNVIAQLNLFSLLFCALLLKVNLDGQQNATFFGGLVAVLMILPVLLPMIMRV